LELKRQVRWTPPPLASKRPRAPRHDEWIEAKAPLNQKTYYYHVKAQRSRWSTPTRDELPLARGWHEALSVNDRIYYFNDATRATTLERADACIVADDDEYADDDEDDDTSFSSSDSSSSDKRHVISVATAAGTVNNNNHDDDDSDDSDDDDDDESEYESTSVRSAATPRADTAPAPRLKMETDDEIRAKKTRQANFAMILSAFAGNDCCFFSFAVLEKYNI
jgi:hypothetical protein